MSTAQTECGGVMLADTETWARPLCWEHWEFRERIVFEERAVIQKECEASHLEAEERGAATAHVWRMKAAEQNAELREVRTKASAMTAEFGIIKERLVDILGGLDPESAIARVFLDCIGCCERGLGP